MVIAQRLRSDDAMQVGLHKLLHKINLLEVVERRGFQDIEDRYYVLMVEVAEEFDLA